MIQSAFIVVLGFALLQVQAVFAQIVPFDVMVPALTLPLVVYMGLHDFKVTRGVITAFLIGWLTDVSAGNPMGLYTFVSVAMFLLSRVASLRLFLQGWGFEIVLTFALALVSNFLILGLRSIFDKDIDVFAIHLKIVTLRSLATALCAPLVFRVMDAIERLAPRRRHEGRVVRH